MAVVDRIADGLSDEMRAERPDVQAVPLEELLPTACVRGIGERLVDLEVVAPARELEPVEAPARTALGEILERQVGPLAGEQGYWACHQDGLLPEMTTEPTVKERDNS
jgi:hypothetical protein